jgi:hypothetical protein
MSVTGQRGTSGGGSLTRCAAGQVEGFSDQAVRGEPVARRTDEVLDDELARLHLGDHGIEKLAQSRGRSGDAARPRSRDVTSRLRWPAELIDRVGGGRHAIRKATRPGEPAYELPCGLHAQRLLLVSAQTTFTPSIE